MTFIETVLTAMGVSLETYECPQLNVYTECMAVLATSLEHTFQRRDVDKYKHPAGAVCRTPAALSLLTESTAGESTAWPCAFL